ncbi:MAG: ABC transporter substrate-binding protein [Lachnospiraceae bacterium]|nr:ABC transporter substrate-binding protein [Candidatus Darwinimomas equi]
MKKILAIAISLVMVLSLAACGGQQAAAPAAAPAAQEAAASTDGEIYIPVIALGFQHQYWQAVKLGCEQAAEEFGVTITFEGPEQETMVDKQVDMIKAALAKNPAGLCLAAIDTEACRADVEAAKAKGLKCVGFDSGCGDLPLTTCATDSKGAGAIAAENCARLLNGKGKVGIINFSQTAPDGIAREQGFTEYLKANCPDIEVVDVQYTDGDHLKSADAAKSMLTAFPDLNAFYGCNEGCAVGIYNGMKEVNKIGDVIIIGFDSSAALKEGIRNGEIAGAITQDPVGMGYKSVEAVVKALKGESLPEFIDTGCYWYDKTNMDDPKIAPLLYD